MESEETFGVEKRSNIYHTFPSYQRPYQTSAGSVSVSRNYSGDGDDTDRLVSGTDDSKIGRRQGHSNPDDETDGESGLDYKSPMMYDGEDVEDRISGKKQLTRNLVFASLLTLLAVLQVFSGVWSQCFSLLALSVLSLYSVALILTDSLAPDDPASKIYVASALTVIVVGVIGAEVFAIIFHAINPPHGYVGTLDDELGRGWVSLGLVWSTLVVSLIVTVVVVRSHWRRTFFAGGGKLGFGVFSLNGYRDQQYSSAEEGLSPPPPTRTSYSINPNAEGATSGGLAGNFSSRLGASIGCRSWGLWLLSLWAFQLTLVAIIVVLAAGWEGEAMVAASPNGAQPHLKPHETPDQPATIYTSSENASHLEQEDSSHIVFKIDFVAGLFFCVVDTAFLLSHLWHLLLKTYVHAVKKSKGREQRLEEKLEVSKEAAENAERRREQSEIRMRRLLRDKDETASADRQQSQKRLANTSRKLQSLQLEVSGLKNRLTSLRGKASQSAIDLKAARFQSVVARNEAQQMQAELARYKRLESVVQQGISNLDRNLKQELRASTLSSKTISRFVNNYRDTVAEATREDRGGEEKIVKNNNNGISSSSSSNNDTRASATAAAEPSSSNATSRRKTSVASAGGGGEGGTALDGDNEDNSDEGYPPPGEGEAGEGEGFIDLPANNSPGLAAAAGGAPSPSPLKKKKTMSSAYGGAGGAEVSTSANSVLLQELEAKNAHLEERHRITLRQVTSRMQQLEDAVETQGRHIAAKEAMLSSLREKCETLGRENLEMTRALEKETSVVSYLRSSWDADTESHLSTIEWVQAEVVELQRQMCYGAEFEAKMKKKHEASTYVRGLRPSLGISISKAANNRGLEVKAVRSGPLQEKGVKEGHIIEYMNSVRTNTSAAVEGILNQSQPGDHLHLLIGDDGPSGTSSYVVSILLPFAASSDPKHIEPKKLKDAWRVCHGLVRKTDLDPSSLARDTSRLKPRPRRTPKKSMRS